MQCESLYNARNNFSALCGGPLCARTSERYSCDINGNAAKRLSNTQAPRSRWLWSETVSKSNKFAAMDRLHKKPCRCCTIRFSECGAAYGLCTTGARVAPSSQAQSCLRAGHHCHAEWWRGMDKRALVWSQILWIKPKLSCKRVRSFCDR